MNRLPSAQDLQYFAELSKRLHMTRTSEHLGVSQPTLSLAIQRLERNLNVRLFHRQKYGVRLSREGQSLQKHIDSLMQHWKNVQDSLVGESERIAGTIRLGCHPSVGRYALPNVISKFMRNHPDVSFRLEHDLSRKILDRVVVGEIDCALVMNPVPHGDLVLKRILRDEFAFFQVSKCENKDVLIYDPELHQAQVLLKRNQGQFKRQIESSNLEVIARLAQAGSGTGLLPSRVAGLLFSPGLVKIKKMGEVHDELFFVYRAEDRKTQRIQLLNIAFQSLSGSD